MELPRLMLASPHTKAGPTVPAALDFFRGQPGKWIYDLKLDGIRCHAIGAAEGPVHLVTRNHRLITDRFPEVAANIREALGERSFILDGEIIIGEAEGEGFANVVGRMHLSPTRAIKAAVTNPADFMAFDLLLLNGQEYHDVRLISRKAALIPLDPFTGTGFGVVMFWPDVDEAWSHAKTHRAEGIIAKRVNSLYRNGRSPDWIKVKETRRVSCLVTGWEHGTGSRANTIGALFLSLLDKDSNPVPCGKVGTGFKAVDLRVCLDLVQKGQPFIVEVEYQSVSNDGKLRFPSFKGIMVDRYLTDCTLDQLQEV